MSHQDFFKDKKITLMGLGLLGRGVGDAYFLAEQGAQLTITDLKTAEELKTSLEKLSQFPNIKYRLGEHNLTDFTQADFIIKGAGVPLNSKFIEAAKEAQVPVYMSNALLIKLLFKQIKVIGITGTKGKSTVTHLIHHLLEYNNYPVILGGNIRGLSTLALLNKIKVNDYLVLELDSWQLQGFADLKISPDLAVFTSFFPDHLNYYENSLTKYFKDKSNIYTWQNSEDLLISSPQAWATLEKEKKQINSQVIISDILPIDYPRPLLGDHHQQNIALAREAALALGLSDSEIKAALETFPGLPDRLALIAQIDGISFYNDTTATTPEASLSALNSFPPNKVILLAGGSDKLLNYDLWAEIIQRQVKALILFPGTATDKMIDNFSSDFKFHLIKDMSEAIHLAISLAEINDIILLSPAAASFGIFQNEFDRGDQFIRVIEKIKND